MERGIDPRQVLVAQVWIPPSRYSTAAAERRFVERLLDRVRALPGVDRASVVNYPPLGLIGTVVLTSGLRISQQLGLTRMDLPLLLGTIFTPDRSKANLIGYAVHFVNGLLFALAYYAIFRAVGVAGWIFGAVLGLVHASFAGGALINVLLPVVHPRMGTPWSDAEETPILEPPGFLLVNYGRRTAVYTTITHVLYGAIVGGFAAHLAFT